MPASPSPSPSPLLASLAPVIVGAVWGSTNALMRRYARADDAEAEPEPEPEPEPETRSALPSGSSSPRASRARRRTPPRSSTGDGVPDQDSTPSSSSSSSAARDLTRAARDPRWVAAYVANQSGSLVFYALLGSTDMSTTVPLVQGSTLVFAAIAGAALGEPGARSPWTALGCALVVAGLALMAWR